MVRLKTDKTPTFLLGRSNVPIKSNTWADIFFHSLSVGHNSAVDVNGRCGDVRRFLA